MSHRVAATDSGEERAAQLFNGPGVLAQAYMPSALCSLRSSHLATPVKVCAKARELCLLDGHDDDNGAAVNLGIERGYGQHGTKQGAIL